MDLNLFRPKPDSPESPVEPSHAVDLILCGDAPANMQVSGHLNLSERSNLTNLPDGLTVTSLDLNDCQSLVSLPINLRVKRLNLSGCISLTAFPAGLRCYELEMRDLVIRELPADLQVEYKLDLSNCKELERLPENLKVGTLVLTNCTALKALPEGLDVCFLDISGCTALRGWPKQATLRIGRFRAAGCGQITSLPPWLTEVSQLDVSGCTNLTELPETLLVSSWVDIAASGIRSLPASISGARLRWRSVVIDERIAFRPETITAQEILEERNVEIRRVKLERMGYEAFLRCANAQVLDRDRDPGGERRLLRVQIENDEDLVCVSVICPSTGRQYIIRVPPTTSTCLQALAWIAGFDDPNDYKPLIET